MYRARHRASIFRPSYTIKRMTQRLFTSSTYGKQATARQRQDRAYRNDLRAQFVVFVLSACAGSVYMSYAVMTV